MATPKKKQVAKKTSSAKQPDILPTTRLTVLFTFLSMVFLGLAYWRAQG